MGCDIHLYVEKKNNNGEWEAIEGKNSWYDWNIKHGYSNKYTEPTCYEGWLYDGRNYSLFSLLADVRNGISGYRDEPATGHYIEPLSEPKGLPNDVSELVKIEFEEGWLHSTSYFTLKELQDIDWESNCKTVCLVGSNEYKEFKEKGMPQSWCGGSSAYLISNEEMDKYIEGKTVVGKKSFLGKIQEKEVSNEDKEFVQTLIEFNRPVSDMCDFRKEIKELEKLLDDNTTNEDIRIVFGFDN